MSPAQTPLKISTRLALLTGALCVAMAGIGALGLWSMRESRNTLKSVYDDRVVPAAQLATIQQLTQRNQIVLLSALAELEAGESARVASATDELKQNIARVSATWDAYMATYLTPDEKRLAEDLARDRKAFVQQGLLPLAEQLRAGRTAEARQHALRALPTLYQPVQTGLQALIQLQADEAAKAVATAEVNFRRDAMLDVASLLAALLLAAGLCWQLARSLGRALGGEPDAVKGIAEAVAAGRLDTPIRLRRGDTDSVMATMQRMCGDLAGTVVSVRSISDGVASASSQIASGNNDLSSRTEEQASALQQTAASLEQLSATVQHNATNAGEAKKLSVAASAVAQQGGEAVMQVVQTMKGIAESSSRIADIIGTIDGIAFQTNILALNAAVEAARAGDQGRGFAVVASEVRTLAKRSADAAREIKGLITASNERVAHGAELADRAGQTMNAVVDAVRKATEVVDEIDRATREQSVGVAQINEAVSQMDQTTQQNAALVEESAAAAESLRAQAGRMVEAVSVFSVPAGGPLATAA